MFKILIVEDDAKTADFVERAFRQDGFATVVARDGEEALDRVRVGDFDVAVVDILLPKRDGLSLIREIRRLIEMNNPACELEVDGGIDRDTAPQCAEAGANVLVAGSAVFGKPDRAAAIRAIRENCLKN